MPADSRPADRVAGTFHTPAAVLGRTPLPPPGDAPPPTAPADGSPVCPICHGAGYLRREVPVGHPDFGLLIDCVCRLARQRQQTQTDLYAASNMGAYRGRTFDVFTVRPGLEEALAAARAFAAHPQGWLILCGPYGAGKTHLAAAIANAALAQGTMTCFAVVPDLLDHLRATFAPSSEVAFDHRFETVRKADLLILDDLGTENPTPWVREKMYQLINHRWITAAPTVITTNVRFDQMDPRIVSRIRDQDLCRVVVITAGDYRQRDNLAPAWDTPTPPASAPNGRTPSARPRGTPR